MWQTALVLALGLCAPLGSAQEDHTAPQAAAVQLCRVVRHRRPRAPPYFLPSLSTALQSTH